MWFSCFCILPGSAEAQVIWGGIVKRLLIAYFIGNISTKKISKSIHVRQSYSKPKVGRFLRHNVDTHLSDIICQSEFYRPAHSKKVPFGYTSAIRVCVPFLKFNKNKLGPKLASKLITDYRYGSNFIGDITKVRHNKSASHVFYFVATCKRFRSPLLHNKFEFEFERLL